MTAPQIVVQIGFDALPMDVAVTWTDVSTSVRSAQIQRGRQQDLDRIEAGTAAVVLKNYDGQFDANNSAGPYYGKIKPLRRIQILARHINSSGEITSENFVFTGTIDSWHTDYRDTNIAYTTIRATDSYKLLNLIKLTGSFSQQLSSDRIQAVLDAIGWQSPRTWILDQSKIDTNAYVGPAGAALIQAGASSVQASDISSGSALEHLSAVTEAENGSIYITAGGDVRFENRHAPYVVHDRYRVCFADNSSVGDDGALLSTRAIGYRAIATEKNDAQVWNQFVTTIVGSTTPNTVNDTASQADYFVRTLERTNSLITDTAEARLSGEWLRDRYSTAWYHVPAISVNLNGHSDVPANNVADPDAVMALDIMDKVNVRWLAPGAGSRYELPAFIDNIVDIVPAPGQWTREFAFQSADKFTGWVLDSTVNSKLDVTTKVVVY